MIFMTHYLRKTILTFGNCNKQVLASLYGNFNPYSFSCVILQGHLARTVKVLINCNYNSTTRRLGTSITSVDRIMFSIGVLSIVY